ncbi:hypothetical protein LPIBR_60003 [Lacticaseibacillus paracasei]|nr:hypothetical protein LPIBR_60003 [Lacticaseibacillus paracasei]
MAVGVALAAVVVGVSAEDVTCPVAVDAGLLTGESAEAASGAA